MPKIVNHAERRQEVLDATWRVIARVGLHKVTMRLIADEMGYSIGVLGYYFSDKEDIMVSAHKLAFSRAGKRIKREFNANTGLQALRAAILEALPLDAERRLEAQVDVSFLGQIVGNERLRQIRSESNSLSRQKWCSMIGAVQKTGEISADVDPEPYADEILALVESLSMEALIDPGWMNSERQHRLTERLLARLVADKNETGQGQEAGI